MPRGRIAVGICVAITAGLLARDAAAGDYVHDEIVAATEDGAYQAGYSTSDGNLEPGSCGLWKVGAKVGDKVAANELVVRAECAQADTTRPVWPLAKWHWIDPTPEVRRLKEFVPSPLDKLVRIGGDEETGAGFYEVFHAGRWIRLRELGDSTPGFKAVLKGSDRYVFKMNYETGQLSDGDELWVVTFAEIADESGRVERTHKEARDDTARMREHRRRGETIFAPPPAGTKKEKWEQRRRNGLARFVAKWVTAAVYRPLSAAELKEVLWLLGWFDSPGRRLMALRWYEGVRRRDPAGVTAVLGDLERDPDTKSLADYLKTTKDWLHGLPSLSDEMKPETLRALSAEQLLWLRRSMQVRARYQIDDPAVKQYFQGLGQYNPMSDRAWQKLTSDPAWKTDPDAVLLRALDKDKDERGKQNFLLIQQAEARQRAAPAQNQ